MVPSAKWRIGIGSPQYRWREKSQSRSLYWTVRFPLPCFSSHRIIASLEAELFKSSRENPSEELWIVFPSPVQHILPLKTALRTSAGEREMAGSISERSGSLTAMIGI